MTALRLHRHGDHLCNTFECGKNKPPLTAKDFEEVGISVRSGLEAQGICPDSGLEFVECVSETGPCDCFLAQVRVTEFVHSCQREIIRQSKINQKKE
jgi:hypothetical protein